MRSHRGWMGTSEDLEKKHAGLNRFYQIHKDDFSIEAYQKSLKRVKKLFQYESSYPL